VILVDTSVWIDHLRKGHRVLAQMLEASRVLTHSFVVGELACGSLSRRNMILENLRRLPAAVSASDEEVSAMIERKRLWGKGIGWIDAHLIASALLSDCLLFSSDERLNRAAREAGAELFSAA
jgi:predicted nucleic acid-binding protein